MNCALPYLTVAPTLAHSETVPSAHMQVFYYFYFLLVLLLFYFWTGMVRIGVIANTELERYDVHFLMDSKKYLL